MLIAPYMLDMTTGQYAAPTLLAQAYVTQQSTLAPPQQLASVIWHNIFEAYHMIYEDWHTTTLGVLWVITVLAGVVAVTRRLLEAAPGSPSILLAIVIGSLLILFLAS